MASYSGRDLSLLPSFNFTFVEHYIKTNKFSSGNKSINKGFKFYSEGYIHDLKVHPTSDGCKITGKCYRSQRKTEIPYSIEAQFSKLNDEVVVSGVQCGCAIGLNACCGYITGLLYQLAKFKLLELEALPEDVAKTSLPQTWHVPRGNKISGAAVHDLEVCGYSKVEESNTEQPRATRSTLYNPVRGEPINWMDHYMKLHQTAPDFLVLSAIKPRSYVTMVQSKFGPVPSGSVLSYQQKLDDDFIMNVADGVCFPDLPVHNYMNNNYNAVLHQSQQIQMEGLQISGNEIKRFEEKTRIQSQSPLWHKVRKHRVTASQIGRVYKRRKDDDSLAKQFQSKRHVTTAAMRRGILSEPIAAKKYAECLYNQVNLYPSGVVVNFWSPWLAASPDRKVYNPIKLPPFGLLEVKCPSVSSVLEATCLVKGVDGTLKLKRNHDYYYQVLTQLAVTGLEWCDFFVWCENDYHLETIYFNQAIWDNVKDKVDRFFFNCFI